MSTVISRLELDHPDLGAPGGLALHTAIADLYKKIGDNMADRYFPISNLNAAASVDCDHNYNTDLANLHIDIYGWNEGTELLTYLDETTTPKLSEIAVIAKVGDTKKQITVTNNSAGQVDLALVLSQEILFLREGDIKDIDIVSTPPEDGQSLVFETSSQKFKPGASGDSSFKFQKLTGTVLTIKKGYLALSNGEEIYSSVDLSPDLATFIPGANADYYGYFDRMTFPAYASVNGRRLIAMTTSQLVFSTTTPDDENLSRYIPIGKVQKAAGVFTNIETLATRRHDVALGVDRSLEYTLPLQAIGSVGSAAQIAAGHELLAASFPSGAIGANLSWYNLPDVNDDSGNARTLTNNNAATFGTDILGQSSKALSLASASSQYLSSTDALFNPGDNDFIIGAWLKPSNWAGTGTAQMIWTQYSTAAANCKSWYLMLTGVGELLLVGTTDGTTETTLTTFNVTALTGWNHVALRYSASLNTFYIYLNGKVVTQATIASGLFPSSAPRFNVGSYNNGAGLFFNGQMDELFFAKYAFTDNDIAKIYASKLTHSRTLSPISQDWKIDAQSVGGQNRDLFDVIVDKDANDLYFDLSDEVSTTQVELKLYNKSSVGLSKSAKPRTLEMTVDLLDALLPITHGLGVVPEISFKVKNISNDYEYHDAGSLFVATATQIKLAGDTLTTTYGTGVVVVLTYATAFVSQFIPNRFWNNRNASSATGLAVNDRLFADAATTFIATLPASPSIGDECQILDAKGTFGVANYVTLNPGASNLRGGANTFDCNQPNKLYRAIFVDATYGWDILY
jgi:hypothetical protein